MECGPLLKLVGVMNLMLIFILSCPFNIEGREPYFCDFFKKKNLNIGLHSNIYTITTPSDMEDLDLYSRSQLYEKSKHFGIYFLANLSMINLDAIQLVATTWWFVEAHADFFFFFFFFLRNWYSRERAVLIWFYECICLTPSCVGTLVNQFVSNLWC